MSIMWWIIIAIALAVVEVMTVDLIFLMLSGAALVAGAASLAGLGLTGQMVVFAIAAAVLLAGVRPWAKRLLARHTPNIETNSRALVGCSARVTQTVSPTGGRVRLEGEIWSARSGGEVLAIDTPVVVLAIDGATAVVGPASSSTVTRAQSPGRQSAPGEGGQYLDPKVER